jgi:hypothetical protein
VDAAVHDEDMSRRALNLTEDTLRTYSQIKCFRRFVDVDNFFLFWYVVFMPKVSSHLSVTPSIALLVPSVWLVRLCCWREYISVMASVNFCQTTRHHIPEPEIQHRIRSLEYIEYGQNCDDRMGWVNNAIGYFKSWFWCS